MFSARNGVATQRRWWLSVATLTAALALTAACESASERAQREEREAYIKSLDIEKLKGSLETVNPDPYTDGTIKPHVGGLNK